MGWREEVLFDHQFFGPPGAGHSEVQKRMIRYAVGAVGGVMTTLNFIYYFKQELEQHMPDVAVKLGLSKANTQGANDVEGTTSRDNSGRPTL